MKFPDTGAQLCHLTVDEFSQLAGDVYTGQILSKLLANWEFPITGKQQSPLTSPTAGMNTA